MIEKHGSLVGEWALKFSSQHHDHFENREAHIENHCSEGGHLGTILKGFWDDVGMVFDQFWDQFRGSRGVWGGLGPFGLPGPIFDRNK